MHEPVTIEVGSRAAHCPGLDLKWPWIIILAVACVDVVWLFITPLQLSDSATGFLLMLSVSLTAISILIRFLADAARTVCLLQGLSFLLVAWPVLRLLNHLTMTIPFPLADARLATWDSAFGFNWMAYLHFADKHPCIVQAMRVSYVNLTAYSCLAFVLLVLGPQPERRCSEMIGLFLGAAILCTGIGMTLPALGAMSYHAPPNGTFLHFNAATGGYHLDALLDLRRNSHHAFDLADLPGLVTFPSFHTAMGVIVVYCSRGSPALLTFMLPINLLMISSTPVFGSHYGTDIMAGSAAAAALIVANRVGVSGSSLGRFVRGYRSRISSISGLLPPARVHP